MNRSATILVLLIMFLEKNRDILHCLDETDGP